MCQRVSKWAHRISCDRCLPGRRTRSACSSRVIRGRPDALRPPLYTSSLLRSWKSCIDAQTPQDWGQFGSIKSFFASHALVGSCAQLGQSEYLSSQASVHTPHISGHSFITDDDLNLVDSSPLPRGDLFTYRIRSCRTNTR